MSARAYVRESVSESEIEIEHEHSRSVFFIYFFFFVPKFQCLSLQLSIIQLTAISSPFQISVRGSGVAHSFFVPFSVIWLSSRGVKFIFFWVGEVAQNFYKSIFFPSSVFFPLLYVPFLRQKKEMKRKWDVLSDFEPFSALELCV